MKKLAAMLLTFVGTVIFAACGGARTDSNEQPKVRTDQPVSARQEQTAETPESPENSTLVIYFSRTGNTGKIAGYLTEIAGADSFAIEAAVPYTDDDIRYQDDNCRANREQNDKSVRPAIADPVPSIDRYDTVFLGYPIWWGDAPRMMSTFVEAHDFDGKTVVPFCTSGGSGIGRSGSNLASQAGSGNWLSGGRLEAGISESEIQDWISSMILR